MRLQSTTATNSPSIKWWIVEYLCRSIVTIFSQPSFCSFSYPNDEPTAWSVDASRCSILTFSSFLVTETFYDHINVLLGSSLDQLTDRRSFHSPTLCQNFLSCFQMPEPTTDGHHLRSVDGTMVRRCLCGSFLN